MRLNAACGMFACASLTGLLSACNSSSHIPAPAEAADTLTRSIYANNYDATVGAFDEATRKMITRGELGEMSDKMHALGDYHNLTPRSAGPDLGKYEYTAGFSGGRLLVLIRIDPDGKVGAYRIVPEAASGVAR